MKNARFAFAGVCMTLPGAMAIVMTCVAGCNGEADEGQTARDWKPFIQLSMQATCSDIRNRLFVIDQTIVFADHAGNCADASYSQILYGDTTNDVLCTYRDSIAGPVKQCMTPAYADIFNTMIAHLMEPDLGLGSTHVVQQLQLQWAVAAHGIDAKAQPANSTMPLLFSYGTLQQETVQLSTFGRSLHGQGDDLPGFEQSLARIEDPQAVAASGNTHHANVTFNGRNDSPVRGTVFEITVDELAAADQYEQRAAYKRISVILGSGKRAWMYVDAR